MLKALKPRMILSKANIRARQHRTPAFRTTPAQDKPTGQEESEVQPMKIVFARYGSSKSRWLSAAATVVIVLCIIGSGWEGSGARAQSATPAQPSATCPAGGQCFADVPPGNPFYAFVNRIYQQDLVTGYACGGTGEPCDPDNRPYYRPVNNVTRQQMAKFIDNARHLPGIDIEVNAGTPPIIAHNNTGTADSSRATPAAG